MSLLFDKSTQEAAPKRRPRRKAEAPAPEEPAVSLPLTFQARKTLGRVDDGVACLDAGCRAECHDITEDYRGQWLLECCFCGTGQRVPAIDGRLEEEKQPAASTAGEFAFPEGQRGAGCTVAEYYAKSPDYVRWAATHEPNEETRKACETYLAGLAATR